MPDCVRVGHVLGCIDSANRENLTGKRGVLDLDDLVAAAEQHAVLADDRAAADSGNADLVRRTLFAALVAVVDIFSLVGQGGGNCVCRA